MIALVASGREGDARALVQAMCARAVGRPSDAVLADVGVPLAEAIVRAIDSPAEAHRAMRALDASLDRLGGSHAQREIFALLSADTARRAEEDAVAREVDASRLRLNSPGRAAPEQVCAPRVQRDP